MSTTDGSLLQTALKPRTRASNDQAKILRAAYKYQFDTFTSKQVLSTLEEQTGLPSKWISDWFSRERRKTARKQKTQIQNAAQSISTPTLEAKAEPQDALVNPATGDLTPARNDSLEKTQLKSKAKARKAKRILLKTLMESDPNLPKSNKGTGSPSLTLIKEEYAECMSLLSSPITIDPTPLPAQPQYCNAESMSSSSASSRPLRTLQNSHAHNLLLQTAGLGHEHAANSEPDARQASIANVQLTLPSVTTLLSSLFSEFNLRMHHQNQSMNNQLAENQHPNWGTAKITLQAPRDPGLSLLPSQTDREFGTGHWNLECHDSRQLLAHDQSASGASQSYSSLAFSSPGLGLPGPPQFDNSSAQEICGFEDILDAKRAPLKHLTVIHDILSAYHRSPNTPFELIGSGGQVTPIGHLVIDRLTDATLADTDPFQASMGLVFLSRLGLKF
ncbi:hypothetical protein PLEOSDRAFT_1106864 [Pleurotus ostreatus PC15]|uniref:Homeobox domain-containing protein n=1 Tax=Pleurotus ostreatus (strain PC15) TaxID=1137138 RepID=A0A067NQR1_PLEO1|nr:hypothetical protein PLEOSDRAFT_1106864 [Pleurotus ostreatus PC15]